MALESSYGSLCPPFPCWLDYLWELVGLESLDQSRLLYQAILLWETTFGSHQHGKKSWYRGYVGSWDVEAAELSSNCDGMARCGSGEPSAGVRYLYLSTTEPLHTTTYFTIATR